MYYECIYENHCTNNQQEKIIGFCLSHGCQEKIQVCKLCQEQKHQLCKNNVKDFKEIRTLIQNFSQILDEYLQTLTQCCSLFSQIEQFVRQQKKIINLILVQFQNEQYHDILTYVNQIKILNSYQQKEQGEKTKKQLNQALETIRKISNLFESSFSSFSYFNPPQNEIKLIVKNQPEEALALLENIIKSETNNYQAYYYKGWALRELNRCSQARHSFSKCIKIKPQFYNSIAQRLENNFESAMDLLVYGHAFYELNSFEKAFSILQSALDQSPQFKKHIYVLQGMKDAGQSLAKQKKIEEAEVYFDKSLQSDPCYTLALYGKGLCLKVRGQLQQSIEYFKKALQNDPIDQNIYNEIGKSYQNLKDFRSSLENFNEAIKIDPNFNEAYFNKGYDYKLVTLGISHMFLQEYAKALASFDLVIDNFPNYVLLLKNKAFCQTKIQQQLTKLFKRLGQC